ncbi:MAG: nuclear transport factor 2 family protein [Burkholderiaceae bacterium]
MTPEADGDGTRVLTGFLHAWSAAIAARDLQTLAALFDDDALFLATAPTPLRGCAQIRAYYEQAPAGLRVQRATVLCATRPLETLVHGIAEVAFEAPGGAALQGRLGLSLVLRPPGWRLSAYQLTARPAASA